MCGWQKHAFANKISACKECMFPDILGCMGDMQNVPVCNDDEQDDSDGAGDLEPLEGPVRPNV